LFSSQEKCHIDEGQEKRMEKSKARKDRAENEEEENTKDKCTFL
jgi:hypothetical protein